MAPTREAGPTTFLVGDILTARDPEPGHEAVRWIVTEADYDADLYKVEPTNLAGGFLWTGGRYVRETFAWVARSDAFHAQTVAAGNRVTNAMRSHLRGVARPCDRCRAVGASW